MFEVFADVVPDWFSTFMNYFALETFSRLDPRDFATSTTRLLDTGAECGRVQKGTSKTNLPIWMAKYADSAEFVNSKLNRVRLFSCTDWFS